MNPRIWATIKLLALVIGSVVAFFVTSPLALLVGAAIVVLLTLRAGVSPRELLEQLRPLLWVTRGIVLAQGLLVDWREASVVGLRLLALVVAATAVTLTTRVSDLLTVLERACRPLAWVGIDPSRVGLVLAMTIRFVPLLGDLLGQVREAQRSRGRERPGVAVVAPLLVHTLRFADDLGDALTARGVDDRRPANPRRPRRRLGARPRP